MALKPGSRIRPNERSICKHFRPAQIDAGQINDLAHMHNPIAFCNNQLNAV